MSCFDEAGSGCSGDDFDHPKRMLVIGDLDDWHRRGKSLPRADAVVYARHADLDGALLRKIRPDVIVSPLMGFLMDALDIAQILKLSHFRGRYMIVTGGVQSHDVIRDEISEAAPDLDFHLLTGERLCYLN